MGFPVSACGGLQVEISVLKKFPLNNALHNYGLYVTLDEMLHINGLNLTAYPAIRF